MAPVRGRIEGVKFVCPGKLNLAQVDTGPEVRAGEVRCLVSPQRKRLSVAEGHDHGSNPLGLPYNSGVISSQNSFSQLYGYFEIRADLPIGKGLWPTFWLLPVDHSWPPELDVFEVVDNTAVVTAHSASTGTHTSVRTAVATADLSDGFHTYGVNWQPDVIEWYIDGAKVAETATPADMHKPMYMLANLAVGGCRELARRCRPVSISRHDDHRLHPRILE
jgi:beta-glucanase (GH16 family)